MLIGLRKTDWNCNKYVYSVHNRICSSEACSLFILLLRKLVIFPSFSITFDGFNTSAASLMYSTLRVKRPPYKKEFETLEAYNSKTKWSRTKLTCIKHAQKSVFYRLGIFAIINFTKEWSMWRRRFSKNRDKMCLY